MNKIALGFVLAAGTFLCGFYIYRLYTHFQKRAAISIHPDYRDIEEKVMISGNIIPSKEIEIKATISGTMSKLFVQVGDTVSIGEALGEVKFVSDPIEFKRLKSRYEVSVTNYDNVLKIFGRNQVLYKEKIISQQEYEQYQANVEVARSERDALKSEYGFVSGDQQSERANIIYSTSNGTVLELPVKIGGAVMARGPFSEGATVVRLANMNDLYFKGNVTETDVNKLSKAMAVNITINAVDSLTIPGIITLIYPKGNSPDGNNIRFGVEASFEKSGIRSFIRAGYSAVASAVIQKVKNVLAIKEEYLHFSGDTASVKILNNGTSESRNITLGLSNGIYAQVLSGLTRNDIIDTEGDAR